MTEVSCSRCGLIGRFPAELDIGWPEQWSAWYAFKSQGVYLAGELIAPQFLLCGPCSGEAYSFFMTPPGVEEASAGREEL